MAQSRWSVWISPDPCSQRLGRRSSDEGCRLEFIFSRAMPSKSLFPLKALMPSRCPSGIRNMPDRARVLQEVRRVLVPGGGLYILEFTTPQGRFFRRIYLFYLNRLLPGLARWFTQNPEAYQYLAESIMNFPYPDDFVSGDPGGLFPGSAQVSLDRGDYLFL